MKVRAGIVAAMVLTVLSGCASHQPEKMYEGDLPLRETAILSALDDASSVSVCMVATVQGVDGKETSRSVLPGWVRVQPGTHSFAVDCSSNFSLGYRSIDYSQAKLSFKVENMKARHVYVARYSKLPGGVGVTVDDLGENSGYLLPLKGKSVRPEF